MNNDKMTINDILPILNGTLPVEQKVSIQDDKENNYFYGNTSDIPDALRTEVIKSIEAYDFRRLYITIER